ncbi:MAG: hypothetical protein NTU79_20180 [Planctomycetota bacterium]|nr:hypothetical protein [Planctomycetota bacterium]
MSNFLPVQRVEYQLTTNVAISQHRLPYLERLQANGTAPATRAIPFSITEIKLSESELISRTNSELCSARITLKLSERCQVKNVEHILDALTTPNSDTDECVSFANQLRKERWFLEASLHSLKRLELDSEREKNAIDTEALANSSSSKPADAKASWSNSDSTNKPFRLISFASRSPNEDSRIELRGQLQSLTQSRSETVDSMRLTLERLKAKSRGFLSLTGSPRIVPLVHALTLFRFCVMCVLCICVWLISMWWVRPVSVKSQQLPRNEPKTATPMLSQPSQHRNASLALSKTLGWMQSAGIPYLGAVQFIRDESNDGVLGNQAPLMDGDRSTASLASGLRSTQEQGQEISTDLKILSAPSELIALRFLRSAGKSSLVLWIGLFAARLVFDASWRELASVAPLAAVSRMIVGIQ